MTLVRFASDIAGIAVSTANGIVSARLLGPVGKGDLAVLVVLSTVGVHLAATGVGEAAIVGVAKRKTEEAPAFSTALLWPVGTGLGCAILMSILAVGALGTPLTASIIVLASIPLAAVVINANQFLLLRGRIAAIGLISVGSLTVTLAGYILVAALDVPRLVGAGTAMLGGSIVGLAATLYVCRVHGLRWPRRFDSGFLRWATGYGIVAESAYLIGTVSTRGDTLLVYIFSGAGDAGRYSVALTVGAVMAAAPWALSYVSFPRLAQTAPEDAPRAIGEVTRVGIVAATVLAVPAAILAPLLIPFAFGSSFSGASVPAVILIAGTIVVAGQVLLCRGVASRGAPRVMLRSYLSTLGAMVAIDCAAIPAIGMVGAALGSVLGAAVGLAVAVRGARQWAAGERSDPSSLRIVPTRGDLHEFRVVVETLWSRFLALRGSKQFD